MDCLRPTLSVRLAIICFSVCLCFSGLARGPWCLFTVHEEYRGAVATADYAN